MFKLLCTTAHPDDEVWAFGGSLLRYHEQGMETHVICLTRGRAATNRGGAQTGDELANMRSQEFFEACRLLQVTHAELLDFPDGGLDEVNFKQAVGDLTQRIREIRPHVVLTLGLEGTVTAHIDHAMVGLFTTAAFHWSGRNDRFREQLSNGFSIHRAQKLYYSTALQTWPERKPVSLSPVTTQIDIRQYMEAKVVAFRAHHSQIPLIEMYGERTLRQPEELFHLAATITPLELAGIETDLFRGITER